MASSHAVRVGQRLNSWHRSIDSGDDSEAVEQGSRLSDARLGHADNRGRDETPGVLYRNVVEACENITVIVRPGTDNREHFRYGGSTIIRGLDRKGAEAWIDRIDMHIAVGEGLGSRKGLPGDFGICVWIDDKQSPACRPFLRFRRHRPDSESGNHITTCGKIMVKITKPIMINT